MYKYKYKYIYIYIYIYFFFLIGGVDCLFMGENTLRRKVLVQGGCVHFLAFACINAL